MRELLICVLIVLALVLTVKRIREGDPIGWPLLYIVLAFTFFAAPLFEHVFGRAKDLPMVRTHTACVLDETAFR